MKTVVTTLTIALLFISQQAFAHPLFGEVTRQRIGNYDFEIATEPSPLQINEPSTIMIRIAAVDGNELAAVPVTLRLYQESQLLQQAGPLVVTYGHYNYTYTFPEPGNYVLYADVQDHAYSGETLTFIFFLIVPGPLDYFIPSIGATVAAAIGTVVFMKIRKRGRGNRPSTA